MSRKKIKTKTINKSSFSFWNRIGELKILSAINVTIKWVCFKTSRGLGGGGRGWRGEGMVIGVMIGNKCLFELLNFRIPEEAEFEDCKSFYE